MNYELYIIIIVLICFILYLYLQNIKLITNTSSTIETNTNHSTLNSNNQPNTEVPIKNTTQNQKNLSNNIVKVIDNNPPNVQTNIIYSNSYEDKTPPLYVVNKNLNRIINPLLPPERSQPYTIPYSIDFSPMGTGYGLPINISTRGPMMDYSQVGVLTNNDNHKNTIIPLYGRPVYHGSSKWLYYTSTDKYNTIKLPITHKSRNCSDDIGCDELSDGETLTIPAYNNNTFKVSIYQLDKPRYIPYIV